MLESCNLPAGVTLPAVLAGCDPAEIKEVLKHIPDPARITEEDLAATGKQLAPYPRAQTLVEAWG